MDDSLQEFQLELLRGSLLENFHDEIKNISATYLEKGLQFFCENSKRA